jgi:acetylornithine/succinyldiaminopimelate/putrescine aminotransferase
VACAAALAALEICGDRELLRRVVELGERLGGALAELPYVQSVRGRGLLLGAELMPGVDARQISSRALLEQRLVINATGPSTLRFEPPLVVTEAQVDEAVGRLSRLAR